MKDLRQRLLEEYPENERAFEVWMDLIEEGFTHRVLEVTQVDPAPARVSPASGMLVGRFEVRAELGRGGMGAVYRAYDPQLNREVAIKVIHMDASHDASDALARFQREAKVIARLHVEKDAGALKSLIAAAGSSGRADAADALRPYLRHENQSVRVNTAIALARLGSMEALTTILQGIESADLQARREAVYGLGFFAGERQRARTAALSVIGNPAGAWKGEAGISLLRLDLAAAPDKLRLLSTVSAANHPRVQAWAIQEISKLQGHAAAAWLRQRAARNDALGRFAGLRLLLKRGGTDAQR